MHRSILGVFLTIVLSGCISNPHSFNNQLADRHEKVVVTFHTPEQDPSYWVSDLRNGRPVDEWSFFSSEVYKLRLTQAAKYNRSQEDISSVSQDIAKSASQSTGVDTYGAGGAVGGAIGGAIVGGIVKAHNEKVAKADLALMPVLLDLDIGDMAEKSFENFPELNWAHIETTVSKDKSLPPDPSNEILNIATTWRMEVGVFQKDAVGVLYAFNIMGMTTPDQDNSGLIHEAVGVYVIDKTKEKDLDKSIQRWLADDGKLLAESMSYALDVASRYLSLRLSKLEPLKEAKIDLRTLNLENDEDIKKAIVGYNVFRKM